MLGSWVLMAILCWVGQCQSHICNCHQIHLTFWDTLVSSNLLQRRHFFHLIAGRQYCIMTLHLIYVRIFRFMNSICLFTVHVNSRVVHLNSHVQWKGIYWWKISKTVFWFIRWRYRYTCIVFHSIIIEVACLACHFYKMRNINQINSPSSLILSGL